MLNKAIKVLFYQLKQIFSSPRIALIFLLIIIFILLTVEPVNVFSQDVGMATTPWVFPFISNDYICQLVIMSALVSLFCNAPFEEDAHIYMLSRAGHAAWSLGMCLYIITLSFVFVLAIVFAGILALMPRVQLENSWGKIWGTLARTTAALRYNLTFLVDDYIIGVYTPAKAMFVSFMLEWACCCWLGLVIYLFNKITGKMVGTLISTMFVFMDITVANEWMTRLFFISPVTLAQIHCLSGSQSIYGLTMDYAVKFFALSIPVISILCILSPFLQKVILRIIRKGDIV